MPCDPTHDTDTNRVTNMTHQSSSAAAKSALRDLLPYIEASASAPTASTPTVARRERWGDVRFHVWPFLDTWLVYTFMPFSLPVMLYTRGRSYVSNVFAVPSSATRMFYISAILAEYPPIPILALWIWTLIHRQDYRTGSTTSAAWWSSLDYEMAFMILATIIRRFAVSLRFALFSPEDFRVLRTERLSENEVGDGFMAQWGAFVPERVIRKEVVHAITLLQTKHTPLHVILSRRQYSTLLRMLGPRALRLLAAIVGTELQQEDPSFDLDAMSGQVSTRNVIAIVEAAPPVDATGVSVMYCCSAPIAEHQSPVGDTSQPPVVEDEGQPRCTDSSTIESVQLSVEALCASIFCTVADRHEATARRVSFVVMSMGIILGFVPIIARAVWRMPVLGTSVMQIVISSTAAVLNATYASILLVSLPILATVEIARRRECMEMIGNLLTDQQVLTVRPDIQNSNQGNMPGKLEQAYFAATSAVYTSPVPGTPAPLLGRRRSLLTSELPTTVHESILDITQISNLRAWSLARNILLHLGPSYWRRIQLCVGIVLAVTVIFGAVVTARLVSGGQSADTDASHASGTDAVLGELVAAVFLLTLYAVQTAALGSMFLSGAATNVFTQQHCAALQAKQAELAQTADRALQRELVPSTQEARAQLSLQALSAASAGLMNEEPFRIFTIPASYATTQTVLYAAITLLAVAGNLINNKYGWVSFARS